MTVELIITEINVLEKVLFLIVKSGGKGCRVYQILLHCIRDERESNWDEHLAATVKMVPYFCICNSTNYSRYTLIYLLQMMNDLPKDVRN